MAKKLTKHPIQRCDTKALERIAGQRVTAVHIETDLDPNDDATGSEAEVLSLTLETADGPAVTIETPGSFIAVNPGRAPSSPVFLLTLPTADKVTDETTGTLDDPDCTCVGEVGEDPMCKVHPRS